MNTKNFKESEFECKCCGGTKPNSELKALLELVRLKFGNPVFVNSSYRCPVHNKKEGGAKNSQHLEGTAADIEVDGVNPALVYDYLNEIFPNSYGLGKYKTFTHIDVRSTKARW